MTATDNFACFDEQTKRISRRVPLKAVAIPGYQVRFASREVLMPYGWSTVGVQVTAACLTPADQLGVIGQGADDTTNAVSIPAFSRKSADVAMAYTLWNQGGAVRARVADRAVDVGRFSPAAA